MRADVRLTVGPGGGPGAGVRVHEMKDGAPLAWRRTPDAVYMVGTAASPTGRDEVDVSIRVLAGASLTLRSAAASVVWSGVGSRQRLRVTVEAGAELVWCPEPIIATAGCAHRQDACVDLDPTSRLRWRDLLVLGRQGEDPGNLVAGLRITVGGVPLLHHELAVGPDRPAARSPAVLGSARVVGQLVAAAAGMEAAVPAAGPAGEGQAAAWSVTPLPGPGALATVVAATVGAARSALADATRRLGAVGGPGPCQQGRNAGDIPA